MNNNNKNLLQTMCWFLNKQMNNTEKSGRLLRKKGKSNDDSR